MTTEQAKITALRISELWPMTTLGQIDAIVDALRADEYAYEPVRGLLTSMLESEKFFVLAELRRRIDATLPAAAKPDPTAGWAKRNREYHREFSLLAEKLKRGDVALADLGDGDLMELWQRYLATLSDTRAAWAVERMRKWSPQRVRASKGLRLWIAERSLSGKDLVTA